ncbi:coiled-coil domain-containing protein 89-like [Acanthaster planci]|uniref:Coiled-coil domain-containing protein 89-like n=1 Tax=Acanthaster planci TaxID=133434 RepID=A0A8B7XH27_ACAPL|nr:coiled-coil domain-containing protein 89-like [Acanthaster planci]
MASSSGRTAKELKMMISASNQDVDEMQENLDKLKKLTRDDKTETAMLRARIDEQSQLICILKQRADEALTRTQTLERINRDLEMFRDNAQEIIEAEVKKSNQLEQRFHELAENHEEMIRIKDDYKQKNEELRQENLRLLDENSRLFSAALVEKDGKIDSLHKQVTSLKEQCKELNQFISRLQTEHHEKSQEMDGIIKHLKSQLDDTNRKLKGTQSQLQQQSENLKNADANRALKLERLAKEKDEMLELAMHRGRLIQDKQREIKELQNKVAEAQREIQRMEDKFERDAALVSTNLQVIRLKDEKEQAELTLKQIHMEYEAYKKHSSSLLAKERSLNAQLRNLVS